MTDDRVTAWEDARRARINAQNWNDLTKGPKYKGCKFRISEAHSKAPMLCRAGQQQHAGQNYWETEKDFNEAILSYLVLNWDLIYPGVINIMIEKENAALLKCQSYIDDMQKKINAVDVTHDFGKD